MGVGSVVFDSDTIQKIIKLGNEEHTKYYGSPPGEKY